MFDDQIGRITPAGQVTEFPIPPSSSGPDRITAGPDGNLWFTYVSSDYRIGRITPAGQVTVFPTPSANHSSVPFDIAAGPDGNLWFTEPYGNKIGRITPAGQVTEFPVSLYPGDIKAGPDGNLWFTESEPIPPQPGRRDMIGRITPSGQVTEFPLSGFLMSGEAFGPDGNLWFTKGVYEPITGGPPGAAKRVEFLSRITPAGQITDIPLSGFAGGGEMTFGPDGNLWYTYSTRPQRDRPDHPGRVGVRVLHPHGRQRAGRHRRRTDGNLWFTEGNAANIGRFRVATTDLGLAIPAPTVTGTTASP